VYANCSRGQGSLKRPSSNRQLRDSKLRTAGSVIEQMLLLGVLIGESSREIKVRTSASVVWCERVGLVVEVAVVVDDTEINSCCRSRLMIRVCTRNHRP
jgi:hypothetical protein